MTEIQIKSLKMLTLILIVSILAGAESVGQIKVTPIDWDGPGERVEIIEMKVSPAAEPDPIFSRRLTHLPDQLLAGNAATMYLHSQADLERIWRKLEKEFGEEVHEWSGYDVPNSEIPIEKLRQASAQFDANIAQHIARATVRRNCDWGYSIEELKGPMVYGVLLNGLQETRSISRALSLRTKLAILESRFDDAIDLMRMNYRLAENVGRVNVLVGSLIAYAEIGITTASMVDFIGAEDSPNMYWALTELPRSMVDLRGAFRMDCRLALRAFPELANANTANHTADEWSRIVQDMPRAAMDLTFNSVTEQPGMNLLPAAVGILSYTPAKQRLIESGMDATKIENMAVGQVLLIDAKREFVRMADLYEKETYLPFSGSKKRTDKIENILKANETNFNSLGTILAGMLLPAIQQVRAAGIRTQREVDALRVIEALRMHAAIAGKFPKKLSEISVVEVPDNPATGEPFEYQLEGEVAVLELPRSDGIVYSKRFKLSLR